MNRCIELIDMEYWFEIYFDFENLGELGFREEKVYWGGEELSQDPVAYLSSHISICRTALRVFPQSPDRTWKLFYQI